MPTDERFGLTNQMRRAAVSVPSNIAEGNARESRRESVHFLTIARASLAELKTQIEIATQLSMLRNTEQLFDQLAHVARKLQAPISSLKDKEREGSPAAQSQHPGKPPRVPNP